MIKMSKKYKYKYWHTIIAVSVEYQKENPHVKVGLGVGRKDKHPYNVDIIDLKTGNIYNAAYTLDYVGRLLWDASVDEISELFKSNEKT